MSIRILKDKKGNAIGCASEDGKECKENSIKCSGCKIYTGHPNKPLLFRS
ncbi:hypothetical protein KAR91_69420 [Candidatus Pacearchaeota archaeon]|nr:hypothetical protein [Candidatus Pacearchaeota archaeon]